VSAAPTLRCPVCRAENDRGPTCRRCRADLGLLFRLEEERRRAVERARHELARGAAGAALAELDLAEELRRGDDVQRLRAVACLVRRDFAGAWEEWMRLQPGGTSNHA
jgi:hypothetical protein